MLRFAGLSGAMCVNLGAYGAHGLKKILTPEKINTYKIGVKYQYYHTLALLGCGLWQHYAPSDKVIKAA
jgi:uncharacterized membrane protein YgdD (TMEM256/DUF423 family)